MTKNHKILIGVVLAVLVAMCIWTVRTVPDRIEDAPPVQEKRVMIYTDNKIVEEKDGRILWELVAEEMEVDVDTHDAKITNLEGKFYAEDGRTFKVTAKKANYRDKDKFLTAEDDVKGDSSDGLHAAADRLEWKTEEGEMVLIGNAEVKRDSDKLKAKGDRIESYDGFNKFKLIGHAHLERGKKKGNK